MITVGELKKLLKDANDSDPVVVTGSFIHGPVQYAQGASSKECSKYTLKGRTYIQPRASHCLQNFPTFMIRV